MSSNLLAGETSPYLLQHARNPVHWRPWGAAALAEAARLDRPILLSIGYAACHWCHVMAHESFEDPATASLVNENFVAIKLDREERPDIDHIYMSALHAMGEAGGWPLTMFLTPEATPFWGGTYFPPEPRWGRPSFRQVLAAVATAWRTQRDQITAATAGFRRLLANLAAATPGPEIPPATLAHAAARYLLGTDPLHGGLEGAPRFPNPPIFRFLWHEAMRAGNPEAEAAVHALLHGIAMGGIYDHLGGGFARYSTDAEWLVPHFEKMLYDNAQILDLLALAHAAAPNPLYAARVAETIAWLGREMRADPDISGNQAFAAAQDADSDGEEGKFYVWAPAEIQTHLGPDAAFFARFYELPDHGNWEGGIVLRRIAAIADAATEARLAALRARLAALRANRPRPLRDDKILADWNGLAIAAIARAAAVFDRPDWLALASSAFAFITANLMGPDGRIAHAWRLGRVSAPGLLEDHAAIALAALALFQATGAPAYLATASTLADTIQSRFAAPGGGFFTEPDDIADLPLGPAARTRTATCGVTPGGNAQAAALFATLHHLTGNPAWRAAARETLTAFSGDGPALVAMPGLLAASDLLENATTIVIAGPPGPARAALHRAARAAPDPACLTLLVTEATDLPPTHPAHGKASPHAAAFLCHAGTCAPPVTTPQALTAATRQRTP